MPIVAFDARSESRREKSVWEKVRRADSAYGIKLRKIARHVGEIVSAFPPGDPMAADKIKRVLDDYARMIEPWAQVAAASMLADVSRREEQAWAKMTVNMSLALREEMKKAPTGEVLRRLQVEQVALITSIPREAAQRVHDLTMKGLSSGVRFEAIQKEILRTTHVTESRATLIARTEVGRASTNLVESRALFIGSDGYIWRTARDSDVRRSHRMMEGKFVRWGSPPTLDKLTGHAGTIPNCRCFPEVIIPEKIV